MTRIREIKLKLSKLLDDLMNVIFEEGVTCSLRRMRRMKMNMLSLLMTENFKRIRIDYWTIKIVNL